MTKIIQDCNYILLSHEQKVPGSLGIIGPPGFFLDLKLTLFNSNSESAPFCNWMRKELLSENTLSQMILHRMFVFFDECNETFDVEKYIYSENGVVVVNKEKIKLSDKAIEMLSESYKKKLKLYNETIKIEKEKDLLSSDNDYIQV
jgi:hypothetical protein